MTSIKRNVLVTLAIFAVILCAQTLDWQVPGTVNGLHLAGGTSGNPLTLSCNTPQADLNCGFTIQPQGTGSLSLLGRLKADCANGTASANAVTINNQCGIITSSTANLAAATSETITLTDSRIASTNIVYATIQSGCTSGAVSVLNAAAGSGSATITIRNVHATVACASTYTVAFLVLNQ